MDFEIINFQPINKNGLLGKFDLRFTISGAHMDGIPTLRIVVKEFLLIQNPQKSVYVSYPSREYEGKDGKRRFARYFEPCENGEKYFSDKLIEKAMAYLDSYQ
jgi:hypothetical protein